jgi:hypothetical protein
MDRNHTEETPQYSKPEITDHGSLTELTAGQSSGTQLDATFKTGTPTTQLTFSTP